MPPGRRYVVTGAAGFIGSHLVEALLARGADVVAVDSFTDYYPAAVKEANARAFDVTRVDLATAPLVALLRGADGVFHLAARPGVRSSFEDFEVYLRQNVLATQRVLEAAAGRRVVFASSSSVYGDAEAYPTPEDASLRPISPYGVTKVAAEQLVRAYAGDGVVLRYFTVYGPRQRPDMAFTRLIEAIQEGTAFDVYGNSSRSFTFVHDVVDATMRAMDDAPAGAVYNVGGGDEATMRDAISVLERVSGRRAWVRQRPAARGDAARTAADVTRIRRELDWTPATALADGLEAQWAWAAARVAAR